MSRNRSCIIFALVLSLVSITLTIAGLIGLQSVCQNITSGMLNQYNQRVQAQESLQNSTLSSAQGALNNATVSTINSFMAALSRSSTFVTCARAYSLNWWAWVMQLALLIVYPFAMFRDRMRTMGLPLLLYVTTLVVINTVLCNKQVGMHSYSSANQSNWASVVLAGLITACISQYLLMFSTPGYMRSIQRGADGPLAKEVEL